MDYLFFFAGGLAIWVLILRRELLLRRNTFKLLLGISCVLFIIGIACHFSKISRDSACGALLAPLVSLGLFSLCRRVFLKRFNREPKDTYLNWSPGLGPDRIFNIVFFSIAFLILILATVGMLELAKAGF